MKKTELIPESNREKKLNFKSNVFLVLFAIFFVPCVVLFCFGLKIVSGVFCVISFFLMLCFVAHSVPYCDLRDARHKKNIEIENDFKGEWLPSGDGTMSYIVDGKFRGLM